MKAQDLRDAEALWGALGRDESARQVAKTSLASQLRTTGLESTLRWLESKSRPLHVALCRTLALPSERETRAQRANLDVLSDSRRALALADALHLVARAR
jgi:hypothetical protein